MVRPSSQRVMLVAVATTVPLVADSAAAAGVPSGLDWGDGTGEVTMLGLTNEQIRSLRSLVTSPGAQGGKALQDRLGRELGLQAGTRITALDEQAIDEALQHIPWEDWQSAPDGAHLVVLTTQTDSGPGRVYIEKRAGDNNAP